MQGAHTMVSSELQQLLNFLDAIHCEVVRPKAQNYHLSSTENSKLRLSLHKLRLKTYKLRLSLYRLKLNLEF